MSESPDIPALIAEAKNYEGDNGTARWPSLIRELAAALSVSQPTTASSEECCFFCRGDESKSHLACRCHDLQKSVPLAVTAEQIAEDLQVEGLWFTPRDRVRVVAAVMALLARSGDAPNFNSQPDLKETGTSGAAPTAQQVPSEVDFYEAVK